jgi:hypothetical protein
LYWLSDTQSPGRKSPQRTAISCAQRTAQVTPLGRPLACANLHALTKKGRCVASPRGVVLGGDNLSEQTISFPVSSVARCARNHHQLDPPESSMAEFLMPAHQLLLWSRHVLVSLCCDIEKDLICSEVESAEATVHRNRERQR